MSRNKDYTITTLSGNLNQYGPLNSPAERAPFIPGGRVRQPSASCPYTVVVGDSRTFPFGRSTPAPWEIPTSIIARDNLIHWWKLDDDPSTGFARNFGLSASSDLNMDLPNGATQTPGGPTEIGSPTYLKFEPSLQQYGKVTVVDTSNNDTSVNTLFKEQNTSICFWVQSFTVSESQWNSLFCASAKHPWSNGIGSWFYAYGDLHVFWVGHQTNGGSGDFGTGTSVNGPENPEILGSWHHLAIVVDNAGDALNIYLDGTLDDTRGLNQDDITCRVAGNTGGFGSYLLLASGVWNAADSALATGGYILMGANDFRIYNKALNSTEIGNIATGDWT